MKAYPTSVPQPSFPAFKEHAELCHSKYDLKKELLSKKIKFKREMRQSPSFNSGCSHRDLQPSATAIATNGGLHNRISPKAEQKVCTTTTNLLTIPASHQFQSLQKLSQFAVLTNKFRSQPCLCYDFSLHVVFGRQIFTKYYVHVSISKAFPIYLNTVPASMFISSV